METASNLDIARAALADAIKVLKGQEKMAAALSTPERTVAQSTVSYWLNNSPYGMPAEYVLATETLTQVPRYRLRPDIYPAPVEPAEKERA